MNKIRVTQFILPLFFLAIFSFCKADDIPKTFPSEQEAYNLLLNDKTFSLTGAGIAFTPLKQVDAMKNILASPHSTEQLISLYEKGSAVAKLYSLTGLWYSNKEEYLSRVGKVKKENPNIPVCMGGCTMGTFQQTSVEVIKNIETNYFDEFFRKKSK